MPRFVYFVLNHGIIFSSIQIKAFPSECVCGVCIGAVHNYARMCRTVIVDATAADSIVLFIFIIRLMTQSIREDHFIA